MVKSTEKPIRINLNQFKLHICLRHKIELTIHFNSPSRMFYLSVMALVVNEMKRLGRITSILMHEHLDLLALLNETVGGSAGSSSKERLLPRIYRKWKDALPDLEKAPLFKVLGRKKEYDDDGTGKNYLFSEEEKDSWANLFEYKGSEEDVRLRLSIDKIGVSLDDVVIVYGEGPELTETDAWESFVANLKKESERKAEPEQVDPGVSETAPLAPLPVERKRVIPKWWRFPALAALIGLFAGALLFVLLKSNPDLEVASVEQKQISLPHKPSIAVLPFQNLSNDPQQGYFSDGMTDDLITDLAKISGLFVVARNSVFHYKKEPVDVKRISVELGVRYVLEGSVQRAADKIRINAQLIDASTGRHLWAERYDGKLGDVFDLQDRITGKIVAALALRLTTDEEAHIASKETNNIAAYDSFLEGWAHYVRFSPGEYAKAIPYFERAVEMDPHYGRAYAALASIYWESFYRLWHASLGVTWEKTRERAEKYFQVAMKNNPTSLAYTVAAKMLIASGEHEKACAKAEQAIALDPNDANNYIAMAYSLIYAGIPKKALGFIQKAMRLDPRYPASFLYILGLAHFGMDQFEDAAILFERAVKRNPEDYVPLIPLAASYANLNCDEDAKAVITKLRKILPVVTISFVKGCPLWRFKNPADKSRLLFGLKKAGLPKSIYEILRKTD